MLARWEKGFIVILCEAGGPEMLKANDSTKVDWTAVNRANLSASVLHLN